MWKILQNIITMFNVSNWNNMDDQGKNVVNCCKTIKNLIVWFNENFIFNIKQTSSLGEGV